MMNKVNKNDKWEGKRKAYRHLRVKKKKKSTKVNNKNTKRYEKNVRHK